jgi:hypothetical protein
MRNIKSVLFLIILIALAARILWWAIEPALPALLVAVLLVFLWGVIFRKKW